MSDEAITSSEIETYIIKVKSEVSQLIKIIKKIQKAEETGFSEDQRCRNLFIKKENAEKNVKRDLEKLHDYESWVNSEITRCRSNLTSLIAHEQKLHRDSPRKKLSDAETDLAAIYNKLVKLSHEILEAIKEIKKALKIAAQNQDTQQALPQQPQMPPQMPPLPAGPGITGSNFDNQLTGMLAIGPLEQGK